MATYARKVLQEGVDQVLSLGDRDAQAPCTLSQPPGSQAVDDAVGHHLCLGPFLRPHFYICTSYN